MLKKIAEVLKINLRQVENTVNLLDDGATIPFIARYRKEVTGSLDEEQLEDIKEKLDYARSLEKRKEEVIKSIDEQGKLTEELTKKIALAVKIQEVEDIYLPYKRKKKTKADKAVDNGLEPLVKLILKKDTQLADIKNSSKNYLNDEIKNIEDAIEGAKLIIAQEISQDTENREIIRNIFLKKADIFSKVVKKNKTNDEKGVYQDYYDYNEKVSKIASHRVLALVRGEKEKILKLTVKLSDSDNEKIKNIILKKFENRNIDKFFEGIIYDSLNRLIYSSIEREIIKNLFENASDDSIKVFKENLKNLLFQPPLKEKIIMGLDPGYRTGCKLVLIDKTGDFIIDDVVYLIGSNNSIENSKKKILKYIKDYKVELVAIGNGTASRETESFIAELISESILDIGYLIVNEAGASVYSASKLAREEFPDLDVTARGAISIARRIQNPLSELVKIDPKSIGVGMYQHDINQGKLDESLKQVTESVVNNIGVNANTASWTLLSYVSGVKKNVAKNIVLYRMENGKFKSRAELKKVKGLGAKMYTLAAGFILVPESKNPLDNTIIHPESYDLAKKILAEYGYKLADMKTKLEDIRNDIKTLDVKLFAEKYNFGLETTQDVFKSLLKDRRDPRDNIPKPVLKKGILSIDDLTEEMELQGTIRNVVNFGAFVDIGLKNDALLHISEFGNEFVSNAADKFSVGDIITVYIKSVDKDRGRVSLTKKK